MQLKILILILLCTLIVDSKRSRGRSRGSSASSTTFWTRKNKSSDSVKPIEAAPKPVVVQPKPVNYPKPAAPKEPEVKKVSANLQNTPQSGRPIGWDVQKQNNPPAYSAPHPPAAGPAYPNSGINPQNTALKQNNPPAYSAPHPPGTGPAYPNSGINPQNTAGNPGYGYPGAAYPNSGAYPQNTGGHAGYGYPGAGPNYHPGYNGNPQGHQYPQGVPGQGYGGYPHNNGYGHGNYPQQQPGLLGGSGHGYGGYGGGFGGMGGYGGSGYGMKKSGGFLGQHAFRNILGGMVVGYLVSGLISRPYRIHSYNNQPREEREEITLPANVLTLCSENASNICAPGTAAICTQDNQILCVTTMAAATPCQNNVGELCVNSTIPCTDANDPLCQNNTSTDNTTTINLPCFTNMTLESRVNLPPNVALPASEDNKFCVTTMAVPDPSIPPPEDGKIPEVPPPEDGKNPEVPPPEDGKIPEVPAPTGLHPVNGPTEGFNGTTQGFNGTTEGFNSTLMPVIDE